MDVKISLLLLNGYNPALHTDAGHFHDRPAADNKVSSINTSTNPSDKAGKKKPAKGGGKNAKQGNILSFFKKA